MQLKHFIEIVGFLVVMSLFMAAGQAETLLTRNVCAIAGVALLLLWGKFSGRVKGWIGEPFHELQAQEQRLSSIIANWTYPDGTPVPSEDTKKLWGQRDKLYQKMHQHPDNPKNRPNA